MTPAQCRMARAALDLGIRDLAKLADVSPSTITRLERGEGIYERTVDAIRAAFETAGVIFIEINGEGPGVRLRRDRAEISAHLISLRVAIAGRRLVRFSYDSGPERWFAPHALYQANDGSTHVCGAVVAQEIARRGAPAIEIRAVTDDFDLARISNFWGRTPAPRFLPAPGFVSADIEGATAVERAVDRSEK
jgi:hypothetical protein